ncbi:MAG: 4'-phosphopantetheinyl transferase superfamily protein [Spirochaetales bacterium]|nr:4'-phosphopantetheinyl transferase superfamily protein [Spirochaetales bacterium]
MSDVFAVELKNQLPDFLFNKFMLFVGKKKEERILKFRRREDAERSLIGDVLIRSIICHQFQKRNCDIAFEYNSYGKPSLKDLDHIHFNLSHSGVWVACAIDSSPIGVDVENMRTIDYSIAERFFSPTEYNDIMEKEGRERFEYFYDLWTLKESYIKARGKGLSIPLSSFSIRKNHSEITISSNREETWYFMQYNIDPEYKFSVCAQNSHFPQNLTIMHPLELGDRIPG